MMILGGIPAKKDYKAHDKSLAGDGSRRQGKTLAGATARHLPRTLVGPQSGPRKSKPPPPFTRSCRPNQLGRHLRGGERIFVETQYCATSAACLPTWHHGHRWPGRVSTRKGAVTDETGLSPVPDKARTPKQDALNAPCHVMRGINSHHCTLSTSCVPLWQPLSLYKEAQGDQEEDSAFWSSSRPIAS